VTQGIVSALARNQVGVTDYQFFIQTDAAINPGNSGGALVDTAGRVIGINTAIFSRDGGSNGIGFAIPANMVRLIVGAAENGGVVRRPWIGANFQSVNADIAEGLGLDRPRGALVAGVAVLIFAATGERRASRWVPLALLLGVQISLGIFSIVLPLNPHVRTIHLVVGAALFSTLCAHAALVHRAKSSAA
jgi:hypothetical protein